MKCEWIKCSDKLPECDCTCLVTCELGLRKTFRVVEGFDYFCGKDEDYPEVDAPGFYQYDPYLEGGGGYVKPICRIIAWTLMPEPFED